MNDPVELDGKARMVKGFSADLFHISVNEVQKSDGWMDDVGRVGGREGKHETCPRTESFSSVNQFKTFIAPISSD